MSAATTVSVQERLRQFIRYIEEGRILEAMQEFYSEDVTMQENVSPPTHGLRANIEREKQFLDSVKEWKGFEVKTSGGNEDVTFYEAILDWVANDGTVMHLEQIAVARWRNGKIVHGRLYYDPTSVRVGQHTRCS